MRITCMSVSVFSKRSIMSRYLDRTFFWNSRFFVYFQGSFAFFPRDPSKDRFQYQRKKDIPEGENPGLKAKAIQAFPLRPDRQDLKKCTGPRKQLFRNQVLLLFPPSPNRCSPLSEAKSRAIVSGVNVSSPRRARLIHFPISPEVGSQVKNYRNILSLKKGFIPGFQFTDLRCSARPVYALENNKIAQYHDMTIPYFLI